MKMFKGMLHAYSFDDIWNYLKYYFDPEKVSVHDYDAYRNMYRQLRSLGDKNSFTPMDAEEIICAVSDPFNIDGKWDLYIHTVSYSLNDIYKCNLSDIEDVWAEHEEYKEKHKDSDDRNTPYFSFNGNIDGIAQRFPEFREITHQAWDSLLNMYVESSDMYPPEAVMADIIYRAGQFGKEYSNHEKRLKEFKKQQKEYSEKQKDIKEYLNKNNEPFKNIDTSFKPNEKAHNEKSADFISYKIQTDQIECKLVYSMVHMFKMIQVS